MRLVRYDDGGGGGGGNNWTAPLRRAHVYIVCVLSGIVKSLFRVVSLGYLVVVC